MLTAVAASLVATGHAAAASSVRAGWWTTAPVATAPDAPPDGLVVRGGFDPEEPEAYAAVEFVLTPGERVSVVRLTVAPNSLSTPEAELALCPLRESFTPAQGGPIDAAPAFDCATGAVGSLSPDGTRYAFDVSDLPQDGALAVAVIPATSADRVVFERPDLGALTLARTIQGGLETPSAPGSPAAPTTPASASGPEDTTFTPPATGTEIPSVIAETESTAPSTSDGDESAGDHESTATAHVAAPPLAAAPDATGGSGSAAAALVFTGFALLGAVLWTFAGRQPGEENTAPIS